MADESGFEIARAWVGVDPDVSDFQQALDEGVGGVVVMVRTLPDLSDFESAIDEQAGGVAVMVRALPDVSNFQGMLDEQVGDPTATVSVGADAARARAQVGDLLDEIDAARADLFVGADTGVAQRQAEALAESFSGLDANLAVSADTGGASAGVGQLTDDLEGLTSASGIATSALAGTEGTIAGLHSAAQAATGAIAGLSVGMAGGLGGVAAITVVPEMAAFDSLVAQGTEGAEVRIGLVPETADFEQQVTDETGGTTVQARVVPDTDGFAAQVEAELAGLEVSVAVHADLGQTSGEIRSLADGAVPAFGEVQEAAAAAGQTLDEYWSQPRLMTGLPASMQASVDALNGVTAAGDDMRASIEGDLEELETEAGRLNDALREVDAQFLSMANAEFGPATDAELADMTARFENLYGEIGDVQSQLAGLRGEFEAAGGDFAGLDQQLGSVQGSLRTFDENLAGTEEALGQVAGDFFDMQEQATRMGVSLDELGPTLDAAFAGYVERADAAKASLAALNGEADMMGGKVAAGAGAAEEAAGGLGGVFASLGERLSYMAVDPFMWMMVGTTAIPELTKAWDALNQAMAATDDEISKQTGATGFNVAGYQKAADQLQQLSDHIQMQPGILGQFEEWITGGPVGMQSRTQQAADTAESLATNLSARLGELTQRYDLTSQQAEALAQAAGVSAQQLGASGAAGAAAASKIDAYANANIGARGPVGELSGDMQTFANDTLTASSRVGGLDGAFNLLVGNFVGSQTAALTVSQDFLTIASNAAQAHASMTGTNQASVTLQQSFYATIPAIEQTANAMVQQGDSSQQVTSYINAQIGQLSKLVGGSSNAAAAVQGLKTWEDNLTGSTKQSNAAIDAVSSTLANQFISQLKSAGDHSSTTTTDVNNLKTSILDTGTTSQKTASARAQLITDLENAGVKAKTATGMVNGFITKIGQIPASTNWKLTEQATGTWTEQQLQSMITLPGTSTGGLGVTAPGKATGGLMKGGSGRPGADDILARLSDNEYVVQASAVAKYGTGMLDSINARKFATGGLASMSGLGGSYAGSVPGLGSWTTGQYASSENTLANVLTAAAAAGAVAAGGFAGGPSGGGDSANAALARSLFPQWGSGDAWSAWNSVAMAESGWNRFALNPSSGAYGIPQALPYNKMPKAAWPASAGGSSNATAQIQWMAEYIQSTYGTPQNAWQHEQQFHWYANGGHMGPGQLGIVGEAGPELVQAGRTGATVTPMSGGGKSAVVNFYGTQYPNAEQIANLKSELALALVGAP